MTQSFDSIAEEYDRWYDSPEGLTIFNAELKCLQSICPQFRGRWIEVGIGTGRFASALGIAEGIDPSRQMLKIAARRGISTYEGRAEKLTFPVDSFNGVLMALTLCFVAEARESLRECKRILRPDGRLLLGVIPADGPWGREYIKKASKGHPVYALAHFRTAAEIVELVQTSGFKLINAASTLFWKPADEPQPQPDVKAGIVAEAGFLSLLFENSTLRFSGDNVVEGDR